MRTRIARIAALAVGLSVGTVAMAQGSIAGTVIDRETRQPLQNVWVAVVGTNIGVHTAANGSYTLNGVSTGVRALEVSRAGYRTLDVAGVTVNSSARRKQDFELTRGDDRDRPPTTLARPPLVEPGRVGRAAPSPAPRIEPGVIALPSSAATPPPLMEPGRSGPVDYPPGVQRAGVSFEGVLFPPELVMQHQRALELTSEQRRVITDAVKSLQNQTVEMQWNLQAEQQSLISLLEKRPINEQAAVAQMAKLVDLEDAVKRTHLATLIKIRNTLTDKQIDILNSVRSQRHEVPPSFDRHDWESFPASREWSSKSDRDWDFDADWHFSHDFDFSRDWMFDHDFEFDHDLRFDHGWKFDYDLQLDHNWKFDLNWGADQDRKFYLHWSAPLAP